MLQFDLENETETIRNYRERVRQCEELAEYAMSEQIREILTDEQDQIALATALGKSVPAQRRGDFSPTSEIKLWAHAKTRPLFAHSQGCNEVRSLSGRQLLSTPSVINGRIGRRLEAD